jgi:hypothetical protein
MDIPEYPWLSSTGRLSCYRVALTRSETSAGTHPQGGAATLGPITDGRKIAMTSDLS